MLPRAFISIGLMLLALIALGAAATVLQQRGQPGAVDTASMPAKAGFVDAESAVERRNRLMGSAPARWTPMEAPLRDPQVDRMLLRQTRHDGHSGLFTSRPDGFTPVAIVLHATGSGAPGSEFENLASLGVFFQRQGVAASHYGIDRRGGVMQYVDDRHAAFHVSRPGWNGISIGIELLNDNTGSQPFPDAQLRAARQLVQSLGARYGIPVEAVVAHRAIQSEDRSDPAANFPWDRFVSSLGRAKARYIAASSERLPQGRERADGGRTRTASE